MPVSTTTTAPRAAEPWWWRDTSFSGSPANRSRNRSDHATTKPQLAGLRGVTAMPWSSSTGTHDPSLPVRGQLAPPSASTQASAASTTSSPAVRSEEHTSELQSLMRSSYAVFCLKKKTQKNTKYEATNIRTNTTLNVTMYK